MGGADSFATAEPMGGVAFGGGPGGTYAAGPMEFEGQQRLGAEGSYGGSWAQPGHHQQQQQQQFWEPAPAAQPFAYSHPAPQPPRQPSQGNPFAVHRQMQAAAHVPEQGAYAWPQQAQQQQAPRQAQRSAPVPGRAAPPQPERSPRAGGWQGEGPPQGRPGDWGEGDESRPHGEAPGGRPRGAAGPGARANEEQQQYRNPFAASNGESQEAHQRAQQP